MRCLKKYFIIIYMIFTFNEFINPIQNNISAGAAELTKLIIGK